MVAAPNSLKASHPATPRDRIEASVIVPCRGHAAYLPDLLDDLARQQIRCRYEVLVVNAGSECLIARLAAEHGADTVGGTSVLLPGQARDLGARSAQGDILAFIDADCRPDPGWLAAAVAGLRAGARVVGGPVGDLRPWHPIAVADNLLQFADLSRSRPAGPIHMQPSCNLAVRATDYAVVGGFRHFAAIPTGEDVAFCERASRLWPDGIRFEPAMIVRHAGRTTLSDMIAHHFRFGYARGRLRLLLSERQARLAGMPLATPAIVLRRLGYVLERVARHRPARLLVVLALTPLLLVGILAWTAGFRRGLAEAAGATAASADVST